MNKIKFFCFLSITALIAVNCSKKGNGVAVDNFDHEAQISKDKDSLVKYFSTHYYNTNNESIGTIGELVEDVAEALPVVNQLALNDNNAVFHVEEINDIEANDTDTNYTMYYLNTQTGTDAKGKGTPTLLDSVYVNYKGMLLNGTVFDSNVDFPVWFSLTKVVQGWSYGFGKFVGGTLVTGSDDDFHYDSPGKGYLFIPSGLGYRNSASGAITANSPLVFKIELHDVNLVDNDLDGVPSKYEYTVESNGKITVVDTDGDGLKEYLDRDDDDDGKFTKTEVVEEYGYDVDGDTDFKYNALGTMIVGDDGGTPKYKDNTK